MVGDIQPNSDGAIMKADSPAKMPKSIWLRCRRTISPKGIEPSSRRCGFQPVSRPSTIWNTAPDWMTISSGAISADIRISRMAEAMRRRPPPLARRRTRCGSAPG